MRRSGDWGVEEPVCFHYIKEKRTRNAQSGMTDRSKWEGEDRGSGAAGSRGGGEGACLREVEPAKIFEL